MADLAQTITNAIQTLGAGEPSVWNTMTWGTDKWGEGSVSVPLAVGKFIDNSESLTSDNAGLSVLKGLANSISPTSADSNVAASDSRGWDHVLPEGVTNAASSTTTTWSTASEPTDAMTAASDPSTAWTEAA